MKPRVTRCPSGKVGLLQVDSGPDQVWDSPEMWLNKKQPLSASHISVKTASGSVTEPLMVNDSPFTKRFYASRLFIIVPSYLPTFCDTLKDRSVGEYVL